MRLRKNKMKYDVIGDVHGQAGKLEALLLTMDYLEVDGVWTPPAGHMAVFLGDLIDRGPEQVKVLQMVRKMVEAAHAWCIMGNHELNAIGFTTPSREKPGEFLRKNDQKNRHQHAEFLSQICEGSDLHVSTIEWFKTLPPMIDLGGLRVVHAWWHQPYVDLVKERFWDGDTMNDDFLHESFKKGSPAYEAMEGLAKGQEIDLPPGNFFVDANGSKRKKIRTKWWLDGSGGYQQVGMSELGHEMPDMKVPEEFIGGEPEGAPVMVGHYWFRGEPEVQSPKLAVLDWSAAKEGPLVAYRWSGEEELLSSNLVSAGSELKSHLKLQI